jgi:light-regulated signal transduction histidine kinase (bacteriophytochrome)
LELKLEELARSNEEFEQFAYVSSHDLQEPLRMITSYLQLLQRRSRGNLDEKADIYIHFAVDGILRMQNLINDLLNYSRVTRISREPESTNCKFILSQVLSNLRMIIKENKATIFYDTLPDVMADSTRWFRCFRIYIYIFILNFSIKYLTISAKNGTNTEFLSQKKLCIEFFRIER